MEGQVLDATKSGGESKAYVLRYGMFYGFGDSLDDRGMIDKVRKLPAARHPRRRGGCCR
jgi:hypothetical protein